VGLSVLNYGTINESFLKLIVNQVPNIVKYLKSHSLNLVSLPSSLCISHVAIVQSINVTFRNAKTQPHRLSLSANDKCYITPVYRCGVLEIEKYCERHDMVESLMKKHPLFVGLAVMVTDRCA
jgi:hypothetical protein